MAKFRALEKFRLLDNPSIPGEGTIYEAGDEIDITVKRADQLEKNLGKIVIERIDEKGAEETVAVETEEKITEGDE